MNKPKIRFKGFEGEWKEKVFSQFVNRISCPGQAGDLPGVEYEDIVAGEGMLNKNIQEKSCNKYGIKFKEGDVLFGKLRPYLKNILLTDFEGVAIGDFWVLRPSKCDSKFLYSLVISNDFMKIANISSGSKMPRADWNLISSTSISLPSLPEQRALAFYFTSLDAQIAASTSRLSSLKQIKAASLLNMFPQKGETVPRVRFKGFQGEWVRQRLGDISASFSGGTPAVSVSDYYGGNIPFIRSGEIHENRTQLYITQAGLNNSSAKIVEKGTILYALYGATSGDVGISKLRGAINQAILAIEPTKDIDNFFLAGFLQSYKNRIINELLQGGQGNLSGSLVKKILLAIPSLPEQRAIASYFTALDAQITLHRERLEKLKQIKAACLEKMFA